jgi:hypothetical protein
MAGAANIDSKGRTVNAQIQPKPASPLIDQLGERRCFVLARLSPKSGGGTDKIPVSHVTGAPVDGQNPANWMSGDEAAACAALWGESYGPGIVISEDSGLFCIDLDACREGSGWQPHTHNFIARFPGAFVEVSQSGQGIHIIGSYRGTIPAHRTRNKDYRTEIYTRARFIYLGSQGQGSVLTDCTEALQSFLDQFFAPKEAEDAGTWRNTPMPGGTCPDDDAVLIERARRSQSVQAIFGKGASFEALWTGNAPTLSRAFPAQTAGQAWDGSAADLALANHLSFWTRGNHERMLRIMRSCEALHRDKWETRDDYLPRTILRACASQTQWYSERADAEPTADAGTAMLLASEIPTTAKTNSKGLAEASLPNLLGTLGAQTRWRLGFDTFRARVMVAPVGTDDWRALTDNDITAMRSYLEHAQRFAPVGKDMMRDALHLVAERCQFDSATLWLDSLVWDGVPRVDRFMADYCGAEDSDYSRAVSRYVWSGMACRVFEPGCQLDMVVALYSAQQGLCKSTALQSLVPDPEFFTDGLNLRYDDDNFKRLIKGKLVIEIAEMAGVSKADIEDIKRTITRKFEEYIEKWQTTPTRYARRCMLFATTNREQFLPADDSGQRRWLPNVITRIDRERVAADCVQLWAEGAAIYRARKSSGLPGVEFENAERLAKARHAAHEQTDVWEGVIETWLVTPLAGPNGSELLPAPGTRPLTIAEVLKNALLMNTERMDAKAEKRVAGVLRKLGFENRTVRVGGKQPKRWVRA